MKWRFTWDADAYGLATMIGMTAYSAWQHIWPLMWLFAYIIPAMLHLTNQRAQQRLV